MAAYVVSARIQPSRPHVPAPEAPLGLTDRQRSTVGDGIRLLDTTPAAERALELRWEAIRERWSQLTFYLFDPESWR